MHYFLYKMIDGEGRVKQGIERSSFHSEMSLVTYLERQGATVLYVKEVPSVVGRVLHSAVNLLSPPIRLEDVIEFIGNLGVMLKAGVPIMSAMEDILHGQNNASMRRVVRNLSMYITGGSTLSEALDQYPDVFPESARHMIRIGEKSGTLDRSLAQAAEHLEHLRVIKADAKRALIYPAIVFTVLTFAAVFWFYYVVPRLVELFRELHVDLPQLTVWLIRISDFLNAYGLYLLIGTAAAVLLGNYLVRNHRVIRKGFHSLLLKIPVVRRVVEASSLALLSEHLAVLLNAGVDVRSSMEIIENTTGNEVYRERVRAARDNLERGSGLAESFGSEKVFPPFIVRMVAVGERTGATPAQLNTVAVEYRRRLSNVLQNINRIVEPAALVFAGTLFFLIVAGLFFPVYKLVTQVL